MDPDPTQEERSKPAALQIELPGPAPRVVEAVPPIARRSPGRWHLAAAGGIAFLVVVAGTLLVELALPLYLRRSCIEQAAAHGITLAVETVRLRTDGFAMLGVKASADAFPRADIDAPEIDVATRALRP